MLKTLSGRAPSQNEFELRAFIALLQREGVRRYLEIGARHGDTFHEVMTNLPAGSTGLAVDLPGGKWGTSHSKLALENAVADLVGRGYRAATLFGDSQEERTALQVRALGRFDAILIDGDHTFEGVTRDWARYQDAAPLIAFHDITGEGQRARRGDHPVEVPRLWEHLKQSHAHVEYVDEGSKMGIGVLWRP